MNLQPLYDLKERLEAAAIAGTGLLSEDFRLGRAAENITPLAAASPVFAKIKAGLEGLLAAPKQEQPSRLLSLLALVDAVAYTQGAAGIEGELQPLQPGGGEALPLSYGQLSPLLEALTGSGGGRLNQISDCWNEHPDYFGDYRVLPALVGALADSYAEIAELAAKILRRQGPTALPLLKEGFDPAGKKEMARRAQLIEQIGGAGENAFYLAQLPAAKKPVRGPLIYALRHCPANGGLLKELAQTERGEHREMAGWALARIDAPEGDQYLEALAQKEPAQLLERLRGTDSPTAGRLLEEQFAKTLAALSQKARDSQPFTEQDQARLEALRAALRGKTGPEALAIYRRAASLGDTLDGEIEREVNGRKKREPMEFYCRGATNRPEARRPFSKALAITLLTSIQQTAAPSLCALAGELANAYGAAWTASALCAALLTQPAGRAFELAAAMLPRARLRLFGGKTQAFAQREILDDLFFGLDWSAAHGRYEYTVLLADPVNGTSAAGVVPLAEPLDPQWIDRLMDAGGPDDAIARLLRPDEPEACARAGEYLHRKAMQGTDELGPYRLIPVLQQCGWTDWDGFLPAYLKKKGTYNFYQVTMMLNRLPITDTARAAQLRAIDAAARSLSGGRSWPALAVERQLAAWEGPAAEA